MRTARIDDYPNIFKICIVYSIHCIRMMQSYLQYLLNSLYIDDGHEQFEHFGHKVSQKYRVLREETEEQLRDDFDPMGLIFVF